MSMHSDGVWAPPWDEAAVIAEFRANGGEVPSFGASVPFLLLTTTGRRSGRPRTCPMTYQLHDDRLYVFASKGGFPRDPDWFHNLVADPSVTVEMGDESFTATARVLEGEERDEVFARQVVQVPVFAEYEAMTARVIPVVTLERET